MIALAEWTSYLSLQAVLHNVQILRLGYNPRVVSNSNAIRAHSHSHPWLDLERRESIRECELHEIVLTNHMNPHSAQWIGIHNVAHSKINSNVNSKLNWVECASVDSTLNWAHPCHAFYLRAKEYSGRQIIRISGKQSGSTYLTHF